jgi:hypothetical protein
MGQRDLLRELHETYIWEVNAAVGEDRMDLVCQLSDEFADRALRLMTAMESAGCGRPDCLICRWGTSAPRTATRRRSPWAVAWRVSGRWCRKPST